MEDRREQPRLSRHEIEEIAAALSLHNKSDHICRLGRLNEEEVEDAIRFHRDVSDEDIKEAIKFFKNFNKAMNETGRTVRSLSVTLGFSVVVGLIVVGLWAEIRNRLGL